jgi:hypothetical protein
VGERYWKEGDIVALVFRLRITGLSAESVYRVGLSDAVKKAT